MIDFSMPADIKICEILPDIIKSHLTKINKTDIKNDLKKAIFANKMPISVSIESQDRDKYKHR